MTVKHVTVPRGNGLPTEMIALGWVGKRFRNHYFFCRRTRAIWLLDHGKFLRSSLKFADWAHLYKLGGPWFHCTPRARDMMYGDFQDTYRNALLRHNLADVVREIESDIARCRENEEHPEPDESWFLEECRHRGILLLAEEDEQRAIDGTSTTDHW